MGSRFGQSQAVSYDSVLHLRHILTEHVLTAIYSRSFLIHLLDVIYIFECRERGDYFAVRLVFFQLGAVDCNRYRIYAKSRVEIGRICFNVVNFESKTAYGRGEILKVILVFKLEVNLEMIRAVL